MRRRANLVSPVVRRKRHPYARLQSTEVQLPDLVEIQLNSFKKFLDDGIQKTFTEISPIEDYTGSYAVEFGEGRFEDPPVSVEECMSKDKTHAAPLFVKVRFIVKETGEVEAKGYVSVRIDRKRKLPVTVLLKALGMGGPEEILGRFDDSWLVRNTLERDDTPSRDEALLEVFRRQRPGEPVNIENAQNLVDGLFFDAKRYDLSEVGRYKVNKKLKLDVPLDTQTLTIEDIEALLGRLIETSEEVAEDEEFGRVNYERIRHNLDEYEHFGNRRLRTVGELVQEAFRIGMYRMERVVRERMTTQDEE